jgi:hypothetical protein
MSTPESKGRTTQPVIAERQLTYASASQPIVITLHAPEKGAVWEGQSWRCGYHVSGLPGVPAFYDGDTFEPDEVWFAGGEDSFEALALALMEIRALLDRVEEEFAVALTWPPQADLGHMVPQWINQHYGRDFEKCVIEAAEQEETRLIAARVPNPYAWDDPRHPSQWARREYEARRRARGERDQTPE